jgi:hypothetical protein
MIFHWPINRGVRVRLVVQGVINDHKAGTTLDALDYVPRAVLEHVGHQLGMSTTELTTLRALYRRQMTLFLHQRWACEHAGFRRLDSCDVTHVIDTLLSDSSVTLDRHRLARQAREALYARHCLIPSDRDIEDWVRRAIHLVELQDRRHLDEVVPANVRDNWLKQLMREKYPEPMTVLERRRHVHARPRSVGHHLRSTAAIGNPAGRCRIEGAVRQTIPTMAGGTSNRGGSAC